jgi:hypothetical protein
MAQSDVTELTTDGKESPKRRFDARDWDYIAEYVIEEWKRRKTDRCDLEKCWAEIDRQIAMEPDIGFKRLPDGTIDTKKMWMSEVELPLQAQALEVLTADARRMLFPDTGAWFRAHAEMTDDYLRTVDFQSLVLGDETEVPSQINQDNADKLVEGFLMHLFRQSAGDNSEDFFTRYDKIDAEAFKYGVGVGRARMWNRNLYIKAPGGVRREQRKIPVLMPCSVKNLYLDDRKPSMHSMQLLEPAPIAFDYIKLENLYMAAARGSDDPDDEDGGWMPKNLKGMVGDDKGYVTLLEMEGDIVVPRKTTRSVVIPGAIVTVALGGKDAGGNATKGVIRFRFRPTPFSSYLLHPYHYEGADDIYPTSPLMKGRPIQIMCTDALNRLLDSSALKNAPPVGWDRTDQYFAQKGGPEIFPTALWGTTDPAAIKVHNEVGGDPAAMMGVFARGVAMYAELTGVLPARLGAQTTSHTTAFAKDAELQRGAVRTVDYVRQIGKGPMTRWLDMAYQMGRSAVGKREPVTFYIDAYGGWVEISKDQLPERSAFEWFGSGGPAEEQQKVQRKLGSLQLALQMDQMGAAMGKPPAIDLTAAVAEVLREGGWLDLDALVKIKQAMAPPPGQAMLPPPAPPAAAGAPPLLELMQGGAA